MNQFFAWFLTIGLILTGVIAARSSAADSASYRYRQTCGQEISEFVWKLIKTSNIQIQTLSNEEVQTTVCNPIGDTIEWRYNNTQANVRAVNQDEAIRIEGMLKNKFINENHAVDSNPWFQTLSFSMRQVIQADRNDMTFWMIRPDNLELNKMKADRLSPEAIHLNGKTVSAEKIRIRLDGMLGAFWSGYYWFRRTDGVFIQYKGVHGPPGTPTTVVQLLD